MASAKEEAWGQGATEDHGARAREEGDDDELRLILVGKSGGGKSATGNTILGRPAFKPLLAAKTATMKCQKEQGTWEGRKISVIDTPTICDSEELEEPLEKQLEKCGQMFQSGLHAFILVTQVGRFTAEDVEAAKRVRKIFGSESASRTIVLFTRKEDLGEDSLDSYVKEAKNKNLDKLMKKCNHRFCGFNNKAQGEEREKQLSELMGIVEKIDKENGGKPYFIPPGDDDELRLILVGKSGDGKSATGNTILGRSAFESLLRVKTATLECQKEQGTWKGRRITVIDTPAIFDSKELEEPLEKQLENCLEMCQSGLHAFILVTQVGRFTAEDAEAAKRVRKIFGEESSSRTIVLFTHKEDLGEDSLELSIEEDKNRHLFELVKKCDNRLCWFNNKAQGEEREKQVSKLMEMVEKINKENGGKPYVIPPGDDAEFELILVGKSGGGKSATGNTILGRSAFESPLAGKTTIAKCQKEQGTWGGRRISVIDTPTISNSKELEEFLEKQLENCCQMCQSGLHAFILVTQVGHFTAEDMEIAKRVWKIFGEESTRRTIVLFTRKEDLGGRSLELFVKEAKNKNLRELMKKCSHRFCGFNNKAQGEEREKQLSELMGIVEKIDKENGGKPYFIPPEDDAKFRLILVGKSGSGKSATGNTILGRSAFKSLLAAQTTTVKCQKEQGRWGMIKISVIDTPEIFDSEELEEPLESCLEMCQSGLHAFILVTQVGRFMAEDVETAQRIWKIFGEESSSRTIVLFTCKEDLGGDSLESYVKEAKNKKLHKLMRKCNNRFCGFNNKAQGEEREKQLSELMEMVEKIDKENRGKPYFIPQGDDAELWLILVGKSGGGKSATGNTILGRSAFESPSAAKTATLECQKEQGTRGKKKITVIDTPAISDSKELQKPLEKQLESCLEMCQSGVHAFLLVTQVGHITAEDVEAAQRIWKIFGEESSSRTIVLFTHKEDLGERSLKSYVKEDKNKHLRELMKKCNHRFCGFNNKAQGQEREKQVSKLMKKVEEINKENGGKSHFLSQGSKKIKSFFQNI